MPNLSGSLCAVDGCRSSKTRNKELSFFHLPVEDERFKTWLKIINRPDLLYSKTKRKSHFVCSLHFDPAAITYIPKLRPDVVPTRLLPIEPTAYVAKAKEQATQTESISTQTEEESSTKTSRKRNATEDMREEKTEESNVKKERVEFELDIKEEPIA